MNVTAAVDHAGWMPINLAWRSGGAQVDWGPLGGTRFTEPFFEQTVATALRHPARLLFRRQTPVADLEALQDDRSALPPRGFIFHLSRCGSTLAAQLLAALPQNLVLSEAPPIDQLLNMQRADPSLARERRLAQFRGLIRALGRPRHRDERHLFIKFDSWHVLELPLILEAFPDVPWIFLYRDPVEIMVSQHRQRGTQMIPGLVDPRLFGLEPAAVAQMSPDEYCAQVLARISMAAAMHLRRGHGRLINFTQLPAVLWESLGEFFGVEWTPDDLARMQRATLASAKTPALPHADDRAAKQREASAEIRHLAATVLRGPYEQLESIRLAQADGAEAASAFAASASSSSRNQSFTTQSITR
ncbi:MAG TPA: sulfotransferase [Opitutaceae bacterium]|jgi:hypothetical protein|nr:sulfotransferase [Opitutaceae bacterium]